MATKKDQLIKERPPTDVGGRARYYGVLPRYLAGGSWNPAKKRQRKNW